MEKLRHLFLLCKHIRSFFNEKDFLETPTPPIVENPGIEPHIHPFEVFSKFNKKSTNLYLQTSPEFHMKSLLSKGFKNIYNLSYSFRDEPDSQFHRKQFLLLEWYRVNKHYSKLMDDCINLYEYCYERMNPQKTKISKFEKVSIDEIFDEYLNIKISDFLDIDDLFLKISTDHKDIKLATKNKYKWDDLFFLLFLNKIEKNLINHPFIILYEYPSPLAALSKLKNEKHCERFELYINGIEIANCFHELTNYDQQLKRYEHDKQLKQELYDYALPYPNVLMGALKEGLPDSSGIALGVERFLNSYFDYSIPFFE